MLTCPTDQYVIETSLFWDGTGPFAALFANQTFEIMNCTKGIRRSDMGRSNQGGSMSPQRGEWSNSPNNSRNVDQTFEVLDLNEVRISYEDGKSGAPTVSFQIAVLSSGRVVFLVDDITAIDASTNQDMMSIYFGSNLMLSNTAAFSTDEFDDFNFLVDAMDWVVGRSRGLRNKSHGGLFPWSVSKGQAAARHYTSKQRVTLSKFSGGGLEF